MGGPIAALAVLGVLAWGPARAQAVQQGPYILPKGEAAAKPTLRLGPADGSAPFGAGPAGAIDFSHGVPGLPLTAGSANPPGVSMTFSAPTPIGGTASLSLTLRSGDGAPPPPGSRLSLLTGD